MLTVAGFLILFFLLVALWMKVVELDHRLDHAIARWQYQESDRGYQALALRTNDSKSQPDPDLESQPAAAEPPPLPVIVHEPAAPPPLPEPVFALAASEPVPETAVEEAPVPEPAAGEVATGSDSGIRNGGWETFLGADILNKIGALILVIGVALFLGYSFAHMGAAGRAGTGLLVSGSILGAGLWAERKETYRKFAAGLIGSGWASLYFTTYAMHGLPATRIVESPAVGLVMLLAVAAAMIWHSLRYKQQAVTGLAYACAFAAFGLIEQGSFAFYALLPLAISMVVLARRFGWYSMAVFGAMAVYATLVFRGNSQATFAQSQGAILLFWLLYETFDILRSADSRPATDADSAAAKLLFSINAVAALFVSLLSWQMHYRSSMWTYCAAWAGLFLLSTVVRAAYAGKAFEAPAALAALLTGMTVIAKVQGFWSVAILLMEAQIIFLIGHFLNIRFFRWLAVPGFAWSLQRAGFTAGTSEYGGITIQNWMVPVTLHAVAFYWNRVLRPTSPFYGFAATALAALVLGVQMPWRLKGGVLFAYAAILFELGLRRKLLEFRAQAYGLALAAAVASAFVNLDPVRLPYHLGVVAGIVICTFASVRFSLESVTSRLTPIEAEVLPTVSSLGTGLLAGMLAWLLVDVKTNPMLGFIWMATGIIFLELGIRRMPRDFRIPGFLLLAAGLSHMMIGAGTTFVAAKASGHPAVWSDMSVRLVLASIGILAAFTWRCRKHSGVEAEAVRIASTPVLAVLGGMLSWALLPDARVAAVWAAIAIGLGEWNRALRLPGAAIVPSAMACLATGFLLLENYASNLGLVPVGTAAAVAAHAWLWIRFRESVLAPLHLWIAPALVSGFARWQWQESAAAVWAVMTLAGCLAARRWQVEHAYLRSALLGIGTVASVVLDEPPLAAAMVVVGAFYAIIATLPTQGNLWRHLSVVAATAMLALTTAREASGSLLTLFWGIESIALLGAGIAFRLRTMRLSGLVLLLVCVFKLFTHDLNSLDTIYRIVSFIGLGAMLLGASWAYTRFREQIKELV